MMQKWADYLDALREGKSTDRFKANSHPYTEPTAQLQAFIAQLGGNKIIALLKNNT